MTLGRRVAVRVLRLVGLPPESWGRLIQEWAASVTAALDDGIPPGAGTTTPEAQVFGSGSTGEPTTGWAPLDHEHPMTSGTASALSTSSTEGTSAVPSRADHTHKRAIEVQHGGAAVGTERVLNLIDGSNVTWTTTDNAGSDRIDVTPSTTGLAASSEQYLVLVASAALSSERVLTPDDSTLVGVDGGAGSAYTLSAKNTKRGSTAIVNATLTALFDVAVPSGGFACGQVLVTVQIDDATNYEAASELVTYAAVNKAGTVTATASTATASSRAQSTGAGITIAAYSLLAGTGKFTFRVRATSGLGAPSTLTCKWRAYDETGNAIT